MKNVIISFLLICSAVAEDHRTYFTAELGVLEENEEDQQGADISGQTTRELEADGEVQAFLEEGNEVGEPSAILKVDYIGVDIFLNRDGEEPLLIHKAKVVEDSRFLRGTKPGLLLGSFKIDENNVVLILPERLYTWNSLQALHLQKVRNDSRWKLVQKKELFKNGKIYIYNDPRVKIKFEMLDADFRLKVTCEGLGGIAEDVIQLED